MPKWRNGLAANKRIPRCQVAPERPNCIVRLPTTLYLDYKYPRRGIRHPEQGKIHFGGHGHLASGIQLRTGDPVTIYISHPAFGEVTETLYIPESVSGVTTTPADINEWVSGQVENITVSWPEANCDGYRCWMKLYDSNQQFLIGWSGIDHTNTHTYSSSDLTVEGITGPFVEFEVTAVNYRRLTEFYSGDVEIAAPISPKISNLPKDQVRSVRSKLLSVPSSLTNQIIQYMH